MGIIEEKKWIGYLVLKYFYYSSSKEFQKRRLVCILSIRPVYKEKLKVIGKRILSLGSVIGTAVSDRLF